MRKSRLIPVLTQLGMLSSATVSAAGTAEGAHSHPPSDQVQGDHSEADEESRERHLHRLCTDPRPHVRARAAEFVSADLGATAYEVVAALCSDESSEVRASAIKALAALLVTSSPRQRVEQVCAWAVSNNAERRAAIAAALCSRTRVMVADLVLEQLAADDDARVRRLAVEAARVRFDENPALYGTLIRQGSSTV